MSARILIAGGTGLIGRALAARLAESGREVVLLSRSASGKAGERELPPGCRLAAWDGRTASGWGELASGAEAIVNLAGESIAGGRWSAERKARIVDSRLQSTAAVVEAIAQAKRPPRVLLQGSAVGYYGDGPTSCCPRRRPRAAASSARPLAAWEAASAPGRELGVRRVLARTGVVLARDGGAFPKMAAAVPARRRRRPRFGEAVDAVDPSRRRDRGARVPARERRGARCGQSRRAGAGDAGRVLARSSRGRSTGRSSPGRPPGRCAPPLGEMARAGARQSAGGAAAAPRPRFPLPLSRRSTAALADLCRRDEGEATR